MSLKRVSIVLVSGLISIQFAYGADVTSSHEVEPREVVADRLHSAFQVTPYMWAAGLKGDISPFRRGPTIGIEKTFSDIMDDLNFGGFVNIWARQDRFVFSADVMYVNTTDSETFGPLPSLLPAMPAGVVVEGSVDTKQLMAALQGGYRVYDTPNFMFDVLAGVRFWQISNKVTVNALGLERSYEEKFGWADPIIGARAFLPVTERLSVQAQADIGGFGVGSDLTWSTLATVNYIISDNFSLSAGYKLLDVDYRRGGHVYDTKLSGPVLGVTLRF